MFPFSLLPLCLVNKDFFSKKWYWGGWNDTTRSIDIETIFDTLKHYNGKCFVSVDQSCCINGGKRLLLVEDSFPPTLFTYSPSIFGILASLFFVFYLFWWIINLAHGEHGMRALLPAGSTESDCQVAKPLKQKALQSSDVHCWFAHLWIAVRQFEHPRQWPPCEMASQLTMSGQRTPDGNHHSNCQKLDRRSRLVMNR